MSAALIELPRRGSQVPTYAWVPPYASSAADEAIALSASAGLLADPWQTNILTGALGEGPDRRWSAFAVGVVVGRQNGKGAIIEIRQLAGLFLFGSRLSVYTAHRFSTAQESWQRMMDIIEGCPDMDNRVLRSPRNATEMGVEVRGPDNKRCRLRYLARTGRSGRGFTGDDVYLDEAMMGLTTEMMGALIPTMSARPNPQLWYTGSAGTQESVVLAGVRRRGLGKDDALAYYEWCSDRWDPISRTGDDPADPETWYKTNPGLGIRIREGFIEHERRELSPVEFARERCGDGDWPAEEGWEIVPKELWRALADPHSKIVGRLAIGVDVTLDHTQAKVSVAGRRADGCYHTEVIQARPGTAWVAKYVAGVVRRWQARLVAVVVDPNGPAAFILDDLRVEGVSDKLIYRPTGGEMGAWWGSWYAAVNERRNLRHLGQQSLNIAVQVARKQEIGDGSTRWSRKTSPGDISALVATTLALGGFLVRGQSTGSAPFVVVSA